VSARSACANYCFHVSLVFCDTCPLPLILRSIWEYNVSSFEFISTEISICNEWRRCSVLSSESCNTLVLEERKINCFASHWLDRVSNLEPSELSANLPHPLSHIGTFTVGCHRKIWSGITSCGEISKGICKDLIVLSLEISCSEETAELRTVSILNHTSPEISEIIQEFYCCQTKSIELCLDLGCSVSSGIKSSLNLCVECLDVHRTSWIDGLSAQINLVVILPEIINRIHNSTGSECSNC